MSIIQYRNHGQFKIVKRKEDKERCAMNVLNNEIRLLLMEDKYIFYGTLSGKIEINGEK